MLIEHDGKGPRIDPSAHVAPTAVVCGEVAIGAETSVGFGAVLTAESGPIEIGSRCIVMGNAVPRGSRIPCLSAIMYWWDPGPISAAAGWPRVPS